MGKCVVDRFLTQVPQDVAFSMIAERLPELLKFSKEEKWQVMVELQEELWNNETDGGHANAILAELERRRTHYEAHPESAMTLEEARRRMFASRP
jgi:hypothetical protein